MQQSINIEQSEFLQNQTKILYMLQNIERLLRKNTETMFQFILLVQFGRVASVLQLQCL